MRRLIIKPPPLFRKGVLELRRVMTPHMGPMMIRYPS